MIITGMAHFESVCKRKLVEWYHKNKACAEIDLSNVYIVWSCKAFQNYKCLASTTISGDGIYAEYTYNGDKQELYEDVYGKLTNTCHTEEQEVIQISPNGREGPEEPEVMRLIVKIK